MIQSFLLFLIWNLFFVRMQSFWILNTEIIQLSKFRFVYFWRDINCIIYSWFTWSKLFFRFGIETNWNHASTFELISIILILIRANFDSKFDWKVLIVWSWSNAYEIQSIEAKYYHIHARSNAREKNIINKYSQSLHIRKINTKLGERRKEWRNASSFLVFTSNYIHGKYKFAITIFPTWRKINLQSRTNKKEQRSLQLQLTPASPLSLPSFPSLFFLLLLIHSPGLPLP